MLMHRGEANPRTRSGIMALEVLDTTPDWNAFRARFENASRRAVRLRQKVVVPTLPTAPARWVIDPDFNLDFHVRRVRVPRPGTLREVFDLAEVMLQSPLDISRPLWTVTLVEGLEDGRAASLLHLSHAVTDGVGATALFSEIYDLEREAKPRPTPPMPVPEDITGDDLMREGFNHLPGVIVGGVLGAVSGGLSMLGRAARNPASALFGAIDYARSGRRMVRPAAEPSPLMRGRSLSTRTEAIEMRLGDLHRAAKAAEGSINDAYLAGLCAALTAAQANGDQAAAAEFLLANMSQRMAQGLREEMATRGKVKEKEGEEAMTAIITAVRQLEAAGELVLTSDED